MKEEYSITEKDKEMKFQYLRQEPIVPDKKNKDGYEKGKYSKNFFSWAAKSTEGWMLKNNLLVIVDLEKGSEYVPAGMYLITPDIKEEDGKIRIKLKKFLKDTEGVTLMEVICYDGKYALFVKDKLPEKSLKYLRTIFEYFICKLPSLPEI